MERSSLVSFFKTDRPRKLLFDRNCGIEFLLDLLVEDKSLYKTYLFDQQFAHQGWSGMVATVEQVPHTLLDRKQVTLQELIIFELLLEIDALDLHSGKHWEPLGRRLINRPADYFSSVPEREISEVIAIWQEAFEWSYYDQVLAGLQTTTSESRTPGQKSFQAMFCIDDRECSYRRYLEKTDPSCETFATPGFFSVEFFFQPQNGKFYTKLCPWPVTPKYLIKEVDSLAKLETDLSFSKQSHTLFSGWLITQTLGFWAALRLFINIFKPSMDLPRLHPSSTWIRMPSLPLKTRASMIRKTTCRSDLL